MIAHLTGKILSKQATNVIIDVGGVGYEVTIPLSTFYELEEADASVSLKIYTHVREDSLQLFGFKTSLERTLFLRLISVSGIGPKIGVAILSVLSASDIIEAIRTNNLVRLSSVSGVGRKTAERLVIELRDKITSLVRDTGGVDGQISTSTTACGDYDSLTEDAVSALVNLGYQRSAAEKAILQAFSEGDQPSFQEVLKRCLRILTKLSSK